MSKPAESDALRRMHGSIRELVSLGYEYVWSGWSWKRGRSVSGC